MDVREANDVELTSKDGGQLDAISRLRRVVEVTVTGVDPVVAVVIEDNDVSRNSFLDRNPLCVSSLLINAVRQLDSKLRVDKKDKARAVNTVGGLPTEDIWRSNNLGSCLHDVGAGDFGKPWRLQIFSGKWPAVALRRSLDLKL